MSVTTAEAAEKRGFLNTCRSSIGSGLRNSHSAKQQASTTPPRKAPTTSVCSHPTCGAWMIA